MTSDAAVSGPMTVRRGEAGSCKTGAFDLFVESRFRRYSEVAIILAILAGAGSGRLKYSFWGIGKDAHRKIRYS
jgi:hypothetical protein